MGNGPWRVVLSGLALVAASACGGGSNGDVASTAPSPGPSTSAAASTTAGSVAAITTTVVATTPGPARPEPTVPAADDIAACDGTHGADVAVGAVELRDGRPIWRTCSAVAAYRSVLGTTPDTVYVESTVGDGALTVTALDARSGAVRWSRQTVRTTWGEPAGPIAGAGIVVLTMAGEPGTAAAGPDPFGPTVIVGVDARTGEERWRLAPDDRMVAVTTSVPAVGPPILGPPAGAGALIANTPTTAVLASYGGALGVDRATGAVRWTLGLVVQDDAGTRVARSPAAVAGETVLLPTMDRTDASVAAIDADRGIELWRTATRLDHPAAADGVAVGSDSRSSGSASDEAVAVSMTDGSRRWTRPGLPSYGDLWALGDGVAVLRTFDGVVAYDLATGEPRWQRAGGRDLPGEPQLVAGGVAVLLWEGELGTLSVTTGETVWAAHEPFGSSLMNGVGTDGTTLYVAVNTRGWGD